MVKKDDAPWMLKNSKKLGKGEVENYAKFVIKRGSDLLIVGQVGGGRVKANYNMSRRWL